MSDTRNLIASLAAMARHAVRNALVREPVVAGPRPLATPAGPPRAVVSLTSFGRRIRWVHLTIESIAAGRVRPERIVLWLDDADAVRRPTRGLRRLVRRGLEIRHTADLGPHKKYFPAVQEHLGAPLVTCDDDVIYPAPWLELLLAAHVRTPTAVLAHRVNRITVGDGAIRPYTDWGRADEPRATPRNFATGVKGVLYPVAMQEHLRAAGDAFLRDARAADDVWLHHVALRHHVPVLPVTGLAIDAVRPIRGVRTGPALADDNVGGGRNDRIIRAVYDDDEVAAIVADDWSLIDRDAPR